MANKIKDGAMLILAVGGVLMLAATAEFGLSAIVAGTALSALSGALAVTGRQRKAIPPASPHVPAEYRPETSQNGRSLGVDRNAELVGHR